MKKLKKNLILSLCFFSALFTYSATSAGNTDQGVFLDQPKTKNFINNMVKNHTFSEKELNALFSLIEYKQSIIDAMSKPAEKTKTWGEYRPLFIHEKNINNGIQFWRQYSATLAKAEKNYGVPAEIIVAIIGVETRYGQNKGSYRVLDALATLAFYFPAREVFFTKELENFLLLKKEQDWDALSIKGSYAGAMGYGQFMPSSHRKWAVDFNNDHKTDIINDPNDAIGSVANYFKDHGWQTGKPISIRAQKRPNADQALLNTVLNQSLKPQYSVKQLREYGIYPVQSIKEEVLASPFSFEHTLGTDYALGLNNFFVITEYNHSKLYAMAVYQLSEAIKAKKAAQK